MFMLSHQNIILVVFAINSSNNYLGHATDACSPSGRKERNQRLYLTANADPTINLFSIIPGVELKQRRESNIRGQLFAVARRVERSLQFSSSKMSWLGEHKVCHV